VKDWLGRHARWLLSKRDLQKAQKHFARSGARAVFLAQLLPGLRGVISIPAGFARMNVVAFLVWNFLGTLVWCVVLVWLGELLGAQFMKVDQVLGPIGWSILLALVLGSSVWLRVRRSR